MLPQKMFSSLLVINYFANYWLDYIFNGSYATRKIIQMLSVSTVFSHKKKYIVKLYQKEWLVFFWRHQNEAMS